MVVRFQGGNNAGHTVEIGSERYVLHLVPSGIFRKGVRCVIGNGLVVDPVALTEEMKGIAEKGFDVSAIELSNRAQLIFEYHKRADVLNEAGAGAKKIGTTKRGIGPAYADKMHRCGIRAIDLTAPERLEPQFRAEAAKYNKLFSEHGIAQLDIDAEWQRVLRPGGVLINFDADYGSTDFTRLGDDREAHAHRDLARDVLQEGENIRKKLPLSSLRRPEWDRQILQELGFEHCHCDTDLSARIFAVRDATWNPVPMSVLSATKHRDC